MPQHDRLMTFAKLMQRVPDGRTNRSPWATVARALEREIRDGEHAEGAALPGESALAERFAVNRHTVRQAMASLQADGLVRVCAGRGSFVCATRLDYTVSRRTRFSDNLSRQGRQPSKQLLTACEEVASALVREALQLGAGAKVLRVETLDESDGQPVGLATAYYPLPRFAGLLEQLQLGLCMTDVLRHFGVQDYLRARSQVSTRMPTDAAARCLGQMPDRPLLCVHSWDVDLQGCPIKYGETLFCGDRVQLVLDSQELS